MSVTESALQNDIKLFHHKTMGAPDQNTHRYVYLPSLSEVLCYEYTLSLSFLSDPPQTLLWSICFCSDQQSAHPTLESCSFLWECVRTPTCVHLSVLTKHLLLKHVCWKKKQNDDIVKALCSCWETTVSWILQLSQISTNWITEKKSWLFPHLYFKTSISCYLNLQKYWNFSATAQGQAPEFPETYILDRASSSLPLELKMTKLGLTSSSELASCCQFTSTCTTKTWL